MDDKAFDFGGHGFLGWFGGWFGGGFG